MIVNEENIAALSLGLKTQFHSRFHDTIPAWRLLAEETQSSNAEELMMWLDSLPGMRRFTGEATVNHLSASNYRIANDEWEDTFGLKEAEVERDNYGLFNRLSQQMGQAAAYHPDQLLAELLLSGFDEKDYTGKPFFSANKSHRADGKGSKFTNKSTKKFTAESFEAALQRLRSRRNSEGRPMNLGLDPVVVHGPMLEGAVRRVLNVAEKPGGGTNEWFGAAKTMSWAALGDSPAWFLYDAEYGVLPLVFQLEKQPKFVGATDMTSREFLRTHEFLYQMYGRYGVGFGLPQVIEGSTGVDA